MEFGDTVVSPALLGVGAVLIVLVLAAMGLALRDLTRREVRHLPKWAWALIIVLVNFPIGVILYLVLGRVPPDQTPAPDGPVPTASPGHESSPGADADPGHWTSTAGRGPDPALSPAHPTATEGHGHPPEAHTEPATPPRQAAQSPIVRTIDLDKRYGEMAALHDVDLVVPWGATYGLIGPNGAGKTTLLSILAGLRHPSAGRVEHEVPPTSIGVLVDTPDFEPWLTAHEVVDLARVLTSPHLPRRRVTEVLAETGLGDDADRRVGGFSRGMLQRLGLATCLVGDPELLVLDEPFSALDPAGRREILELVGRLAHSKTVILSTHILSDVQQLCDVVGVIDRGTLRFQGPLTDLLGRTATVYALQVRGPAGGVLKDLEERSWVLEVHEQAPGRLRLVVTDAERAEREVAGVLTAHDARLVAFYPATDLETAFLELTS